MQDLLFDEDFEMKINNDGDLVIGNSDILHKEMLLICSKGAYKATPAACVGLWSYLEAEDPAELIAEVKTQFKGDGMEVKRVEIIDGKLLHEAEYK